MGEITEMMSNGTLCETCGKFIGGSCGYPRKCESCTNKNLQYDKLIKDIYDYAFKNIKKFVDIENTSKIAISKQILYGYLQDGKYKESISPVLAQKVEDKLWENKVLRIW